MKKANVPPTITARLRDSREPARHSRSEASTTYTNGPSAANCPSRTHGFGVHTPSMDTGSPRKLTCCRLWMAPICKLSPVQKFTTIASSRKPKASRGHKPVSKMRPPDRRPICGRGLCIHGGQLASRQPDYANRHDQETQISPRTPLPKPDQQIYRRQCEAHRGNNGPDDGDPTHGRTSGGGPVTMG